MLRVTSMNFSNSTDRKLRLLDGAVLLVGAAIAVLFAVHVLATVFRAHDDEGYMLGRLVRYMSAQPVDGHTYDQYGPFFYGLLAGWFRVLQLPVTHDTSRLATLVAWLASGACGGIFVYRISRSVVLGTAAMLACVRVGAVLANEPGHPQEVVMPLLLLACCLAADGDGKRGGVRVFLLGAVGAALVFTKINAGVFYLAALGQTLVCMAPKGRLRTVALGSVAGYVVAMPVLLMRAHLASGSGALCILAVLCGGTTLLCAARVGGVARLGWGSVGIAGAGVGAALGLMTLAVRVQGLGVGELVQSIAIVPMRMGAFWHGVFLLAPPALAACVIAGMGVVVLLALPEQRARYGRWMGLLRCAAGVCAIGLLVRGDLGLVVPVIGLGLIPVAGRQWTRGETLVRIFVAELCVNQLLQTYPIAGSQVAIASAPVVVWAFVCVYDGLEEWRAAGGAAVLGERAVGFAMAVAILVVMLSSGMPLWGYAYPSSGLRGAEWLHLPPEQAKTLRQVTADLRANCSQVFTTPRMVSFNYWTGLPSPDRGTPQLMSLQYTAAERKWILEQLEGDAGACVVYSPGMLAFWHTTPAELETVEWGAYLLHEMRVVEEVGGYGVRVSRRRTAAWVRQGIGD